MTKCQIIIFVYLIIFLFACKASNNVFTSKIETSQDSTYGYTITNPIKIKEGDLDPSLDAEGYYLKHLITVNDEILILAGRYIVSNPKFNKKGIHIEDRFNGEPIIGGNQFLDRYVFTIQNKPDSIILFLDLYKRGMVYAPVGLKFINSK